MSIKVLPVNRTLSTGLIVLNPTLQRKIGIGVNNFAGNEFVEIHTRLDPQGLLVKFHVHSEHKYYTDMPVTDALEPVKITPDLTAFNDRKARIGKKL